MNPKKSLPKISAYHPVIEVVNGANKEFIELDLDDWYPVDEVEQALRESTDAKTAGEAVQAIRDGKVCEGGRCLGARICGERAETVSLPWGHELS